MPPTRVIWNKRYAEDLSEICGKQAVLTDPVSLLAYESDALAFHRSAPDCVVIPTSTDDLIQVINYCSRHPFPYQLRGAGTSLSGGPVAEEGGLIIHLSRLNNILEINTDDMYCVVEPGVVLNTLNHELLGQNAFYPPDPSSSYACTVGGTVAENAGGIRGCKYGSTVNYVLGIEAILCDGRVVRFGGPAGGYGSGEPLDWRALLVGSEGMLAAFTRFWLRILPRPEKIWTLLASYHDMHEAIDACNALARHPAEPVAIELIDKRVVQLVENSNAACGLDPDSWALLSELDGPAELVDRQIQRIEALCREKGAHSISVTCDETERLRLWRARKSGGGLMGQLSPDLLIQDAVLPRGHLADVLEMLYREGDAAGLPVLNVFHAGDGNLHPNILFDSRIDGQLEKVRNISRKLMEHTVAVGGTLSGEHGIGSDKCDYIPLIFNERQIACHQAVANCFNPEHRLNPGKMLPQRSFVGCCTPLQELRDD